jgi:hypothetical protein
MIVGVNHPAAGNRQPGGRRVGVRVLDRVDGITCVYVTPAAKRAGVQNRDGKPGFRLAPE